MNFDNIYFQTNILKPNSKIIALSDIHGDLQSLIISLRDCGKVIKKKNNTFDPNKYDSDLEIELEKDLNEDSTYKSDLGYEWIGGETIVVICGDMIDPNRTKMCKKLNGHECTYYPQIELKIIMFINVIGAMAKNTGGNIIKLLGNHELVNTTSGEISENFISKYAFPIGFNNYYKGVSRSKIFNVGQEGFKLLFEGGCGILVKVNNWIFIHGGLASKPYEYFNELNQWFCNPDNQDTNSQTQWENKIQKSELDNQIGKSPLWTRNLGDPSEMSNRLDKSNELDKSNRLEKSNGLTKSNNNFCIDLVNLFKIFKGDGLVIKEDSNDLKLVIGHCVQSDLSIFQNELSYSNNSFEYGQTLGTIDLEKSDLQVDVIGGKIYTGKSIFNKLDKSKVFGISMECETGTDNLARLYRVDIGSSRGYDYFRGHDNMIITPEEEIKYIYSKTPQILIIEPTNKVTIVKSKIKNTRIHLPRPQYESAITNVPELDIHSSNNLHYKSKYIKYKEKYLKLKNLK